MFEGEGELVELSFERYAAARWGMGRQAGNDGQDKRAR